MRPNEKNLIESAKQGFEKALFSEDYDQIHLDDQHLTDLLRLCQIVEGKRYLDLGTGNGYIAFELAKIYPHVVVTGLDIVDKAMAVNNQKAKAEQLHHLNFIDCQGIVLPFDDAEFFGVKAAMSFTTFLTPCYR